MTERWLPVVGYEGLYEVSDLGGVRRVVADDAEPYVLKASANKKGHLHVSLSRDGERKDFLVHRLVLIAFVGPCPEGMEACHNDGRPANNVVSNLRWDTQSANTFDRVKHGTHHEANKTSCPRGHALEGANLVPSVLIQGRRNCLACSRARRHCRKRDIPLSQEIADRYYDEIARDALRTAVSAQGEPSDAQELLSEADALVEAWDRKGSWSADSPVGMVMQLAAALRAALEVTR